jgi:hypothetical protein
MFRTKESSGMILALMFFLSFPLFAQNEGTIPELVRQPQRGEAPRYPRDTVIGELGPGEAPEEAYRLARNLLNALIRDNRDSMYLRDLSPSRRNEIAATLLPINPSKFRIGGGREEPDGSVSFLFRILGRNYDIAGELYVRKEEEIWRFDDFIIEEPQDFSVREAPYPYDFVPYERVF